jgi:general nucleoside transport system permease protein
MVDALIASGMLNALIASGMLNALIASALAAAVPLVLAALGELVAERAGVLNLGVEGMMLIGALAGFAAVAGGSHLAFSLLLSILAGAAAAMVFAVLTLTLQANQVAAGLALTILGSGLTAFLGRQYVGFRAPQSFGEIELPGATLPVIGPLLSMNVLAYAALALVAATVWFLYRTRAGLALRALGESPPVGRSLGLQVTRVRYAATLFGGAMAGGYYALAQFKMWQEGLTSGNGWIALALVVFAGWRPWRLVLGALIFGGVTSLALNLQAAGVHASPFVLGALPYLATIVALVLISRRVDTPAWLGKPFFDGD